MEAGSGCTLLPSRAQEWDGRSSTLRVAQSGWEVLDRAGGSQVPRWFPAGVGAGLQGCSSFSQRGNNCMQSTPTLVGKLLSKSLPGLRNTEHAQGCCPLPHRHAGWPQQGLPYAAQGKSGSCGHILRVLVSGSPPQASWGCRGSSPGSALYPTDMRPSPAPNRVSSGHCLGSGQRGWCLQTPQQPWAPLRSLRLLLTCGWGEAPRSRRHRPAGVGGGGGRVGLHPA